jgi:hypothetical protein
VLQTFCSRKLRTTTAKKVGRIMPEKPKKSRALPSEQRLSGDSQVIYLYLNVLVTGTGRGIDACASEQLGYIGGIE